MKPAALLLLIPLLTLNCTKSDTTWIHATVVGKDGNCHLPLLDFGRDYPYIEKITGVKGQHFCIAINLPPADTAANTQIEFQPTAPGPDEGVACITLYLNYPEIKIT